uniref:Putative secreted protein n=1 Tax=Anopheles darlingi TaxID=43151 RepID=A0A2M4D219_ANODA
MISSAKIPTRSGHLLWVTLLLPIFLLLLGTHSLAGPADEDAFSTHTPRGRVKHRCATSCPHSGENFLFFSKLAQQHTRHVDRV